MPLGAQRSDGLLRLGPLLWGGAGIHLFFTFYFRYTTSVNVFNVPYKQAYYVKKVRCSSKKEHLLQNNIFLLLRRQKKM